MHPEIRKTIVTTETVYSDGGKAATSPLVMIAAAAVVTNPWADKGYVDDLSPAIRELAPVLGELLTGLIIREAGGGEKVVAYGKCAVTGLAGELEHASALIHTLHFGNHYRSAVKGKTYLAFNNTRGPANSPILIPMMGTSDEGTREHYLTMQFAINDAPFSNEIVVALGAALGGRPHHRIGNRYLDLKELGHDQKNPAAV
ncbi:MULTISPECIES: amino acid synthesis family protein [Tatumella]|uniref:Amino acid synthesis family protein n=1 Tax=Tatumella punctata TaxID=399969 RepID=A0ABW1VJ01_9GAMM|nr:MULTISPECIES: amino acid synthesis family protein [unclassified Tatumella]MBS0855517.1 amino acid synthesis family protein [Tatumella sp. JGM16]MBS0877101.1 amino acid synthesis family protein [Tatumella sp. JGM82]MBS0890631.1 amino acid synthesis family protein [Tatumella sp. JGM94]MBS0893303.1 amino acid synthesis family protein [Tatumella sp. JGM130]MBS0901404.1 amino acid synthesis family protein [Tatumella sp. JGM100]